MKRVLIISRIFAPCASVGGHRAVKLARRIGDCGWEPIVLTAPPACQEPVDPTFGKDVLDNCHVVTVPCRSLWQHSQDWKKTRSPAKRLILKAGRALDRLSRTVLPFDCADLWMRAAVGRGTGVVRRFGVDAIWATSPLLSAAVLARKISLRTGVPYVVDFRDVTSMSRNPTGAGRRILQIERAVVEGAAAVTYVSPSQRGVLMARCPSLEQKPCRLIYNWFEADEADRFAPRRFEHPTILHGGVLYGGQRRLEAFLQAIALLRDRGNGPDLRFVQHSIEGDLSYLRADCHRMGIADAVSIGGVLQRPEFMSACKGADVLLLVVGHDANGSQHAGAIPGKLYDYLAARRPILVIGPAHNEAGLIVERTRRGLSVRDDDAQEIAGAIRRLLEAPGSDRDFSASIDALGQFESRRAVQAIAELLEGTCRRVAAPDR